MVKSATARHQSELWGRTMENPQSFRWKGSYLRKRWAERLENRENSSLEIVSDTLEGIMGAHRLGRREEKVSR